MWVIRDKEAIDEFERRNGLVAVYLDHGYDGRITQLISDIARAFDEQVGSAWHLLIPVSDGYVPDGHVAPEQYNIALATRIAREREIPMSKLPALVFEFIPGKEYYTVSLAGMSDDRIRSVVTSMGEISIEEFRGGRRGLKEFREAAHHRIVRYLLKEKLLNFAGGAGTILATVIATIAAVKTIGG